MKKKVISALLVATMLVVCSVNVFAASKITVETANTGYSAATTVNSSITAEMLGEDVVVTVPALITINSSSDKTGTVYKSSGTVTIKGTTGENNFTRVLIEPRTTLTNTTNSSLKVETVNVFRDIECGPVEHYTIQTLSNMIPQAIPFTDSTVVSPYQGNINCAMVKDLATRASAWFTVDFKIDSTEIPVVGTYTGTAKYYINTGTGATIGSVVFNK